MDNLNNDHELILKRIEEQLSLILVKLKLGANTDTANILFDNQEFIQVMSISKRLAQCWRDEGVISFSQIGSKIYYRLDDITTMLNNNYKQASKKV